MCGIRIPQNDLYWLAGLLEGEGSFCAAPPSAPNRPIVTVCMTDVDVIRKVADLLGERYFSPRIRKDHWKPSFRVLIRGHKAMDIMKTLYPLMGTRRKQQIEKALASYIRPQRSKLGLSDETVLAIYRRASTGESYQRLADEYSVGYATVVDIKLGRTWRHITQQGESERGGSNP